MRNFQTLDAFKLNQESESLEFYANVNHSDHPLLALRREGLYVTISASYGPLELALRPRYEDLARTLSRLAVVEGLSTTRQVGTAQAYLALGLSSDDELLVRLTIVADAAGHFSLNMALTAQAKEALFDWLEVAKAH
ncbi:MAG: hypothetical protein U0528_21525 [Anaerolineae bacterium]|nr:hypothetical protein [Anaerolineae bacterium]